MKKEEFSKLPGDIQSSIVDIKNYLREHNIRSLNIDICFNDKELKTWNCDITGYTKDLKEIYIS